MAIQKPTLPAKKKPHFFGSLLDGVAWGVRQAALPLPEMDWKKKKKFPPKKK